MLFSLEGKDGLARAGFVETGHGRFATPAFMPVGTQGTVKGVNPAELVAAGVEIILSNTYHLYLRPGIEVLKNAGGLHRLMAWNKPVLTDSGGYQVFSLSDLRKIEEEGVEFRSHLDGSSHLFTPESVVDIQRAIGSDIMMVLDECIPYPSERDYVIKSTELTTRWARRCLERFTSTQKYYKHEQALFAIVQGGVYKDLRTASANDLTQSNFDGFAIGGLAVGESADLMYEIVEHCTPLLPADKPRYLMGVGTPENLLEAIDRGVDMFDCVMPTRNGRNATVFTANGTLNLTNAKFKSDPEPVENGCDCYCCATFSRAYLRHLFQAGEILALQLASIHNISFYERLMRRSRRAILEGNFGALKRDYLSSLRREPAAVSSTSQNI